MTTIYDKIAKKKATNISINSNLSKKVKESVKWIEKNKDAINDYNQRVSKDGVFSDNLRSF